MKSLPGANVTKGMIFAGCSFTWGQGLYYYTNSTTLTEPPPDQYNSDLLNDNHLESIKHLRYPRHVANHFGTYELCQPFNGGATYSIIDWWTRCFKHKHDGTKTESNNHGHNPPIYNYDDIGYVFFQFTQWARSQSHAYLKNDNGELSQNVHSQTLNQGLRFKHWLDERNMTLDDYIELAKHQDVVDVKNFLLPFAERGIKVYVMSWEEDMVDPILRDSWFRDRYIKFYYKNKEYMSIGHMMNEQISTMFRTNGELTIKYDYGNFEIPPQDHHPSKLCHRVIADSIIRHLEQEAA